VDGRIVANDTTHEVACYGGAIPSYSFTGNHGISYVKGTTIHLDATYRPHDLTSTNPATIQYQVVYNGNVYDSPVLQFGEQNEAECVHGLWGMLNDGRVGGYFQPRANTGAALSATWSNITYAPCGQVGTVAIRPEKLNTNSHGRLVTAFIEPPTGSSPSDIDVGSILLNGSLGVAGGSPSEVVNFGGAPSLLVKFSRFGLIGAVGGSGSVTVTGLIGCDCFAATGQVDPVALPALAQPADGSVLSGGAETQVQWQKTSDPTVDLVSSYDGGATWNIEAENIPNTGSYTWSVPSVNASGVRLGVVEIAFADPTGLVTDAELGESGGFQIASAAGVGDGALSFALRKVWPSPARGAFSVTFSLPTSGRATLSLFDVGGRLVTSREVGALGAGLHSVTLGQREALRPGLYLVRLTQAGKSLTGRALVVQ